MPMPTTRRGRYLFYQERYRRRLKRLRKKGGNPGALSNHQHAYKYEFPLQRMQFPKLYPKYWWTEANPFVTGLIDDEKGGYKVWPVHRAGPPIDDDHTPPYHNHVAVVGWMARRIRYVPKVRTATRVYVGPKPGPPDTSADLWWMQWYRGKFYPSGQANPLWELMPPGARFPQF